MKFNEDIGTSKHHLQAYGNGWIQVNNKRLERTLVITPETLIENWGPHCYADLRQQHIALILEIDAEIILIGTGGRHLLPSPEIHKSLVDNGAGFEIMTTPAACRTYQVLSAESRSVLAILFPK